MPACYVASGKDAYFRQIQAQYQKNLGLQIAQIFWFTCWDDELSDRIFFQAYFLRLCVEQFIYKLMNKKEKEIKKKKKIKGKREKKTKN